MFSYSFSKNEIVHQLERIFFYIIFLFFLDFFSYQYVVLTKRLDFDEI